MSDFENLNPLKISNATITYDDGQNDYFGDCELYDLLDVKEQCLDKQKVMEVLHEVLFEIRANEPLVKDTFREGCYLELIRRLDLGNE